MTDRYLMDGQGRRINYVRISITDQCNLRCKYCMPKDHVFYPNNNLLTKEEIIYFAQRMVNLGVTHIRVTGGEPLLSSDCLEILRALKEIKGIETVTLTTNAVLLKTYLDELKNIGINGINISLDTLSDRKDEELTGKGELPTVLEAIELSVALGIPTKVNCVVLGDWNLEDVKMIACLAEQHEVDVRFIEVMPLGLGKGFTHISNQQVLRGLEEVYPDLHRDASKRGYGPAEYYRARKLKGAIGFIGALSCGFCKDCNRVRLTSDGYFKLCLHSNLGCDFKSMLQENLGEQQIEERIREMLILKPKCHEMTVGGQSDSHLKPQENRTMAQIGG